MKPDEEALRRDLAAPTFKVGERRGKWALRGLRSPSPADGSLVALLFVAAATRPGGPAGFLLRSECSGYSGSAPTSQLWDGRNDTALDVNHRPKTAQGVMLAFSTWGQCLYHPIDRLARAHWPDAHKELVWTPDKDITFLLETVYELVNGSDYVGADLPDGALKVPASFVDGDASRAA